MVDVTRMLQAIERGEAHNSAELLPLVYDELRRLAAHKLSQERPGQTLQATALVHEAWLRLAGADSREWEGRKHFFAAAVEVNELTSRRFNWPNRCHRTTSWHWTKR